MITKIVKRDGRAVDFDLDKSHRRFTKPLRLSAVMIIHPLTNSQKRFVNISKLNRAQKLLLLNMYRIL